MGHMIWDSLNCLKTVENAKLFRIKLKTDDSLMSKFNVADTNRDGIISRQEFINFMKIHEKYSSN